MTTNDDMTPRQPDENEQLEELLGDALDLVDETVARITDAEVSEHLRKVLSQSGYTGQVADKRDDSLIRRDEVTAPTAVANERTISSALRQMQYSRQSTTTLARSIGEAIPVPGGTITKTTVEIPGYVAGTWTIDPVHSEVSFVVRHMMVSKVRGRFDNFEGTIVTAPDPLQSSVTATVDLSSVNTGEPNRDNHIRSADFFEVESHPTMTFRSTDVRPDGDDFLLDGELTIRGITRLVTLKLEVYGFGPDAFGGTRAGFSATGEINRNDFGVSYNGPIPGGGVAVSEKVTINIEAEGVLTKNE